MAAACRVAGCSGGPVPENLGVCAWGGLHGATRMKKKTCRETSQRGVCLAGRAGGTFPPSHSPARLPSTWAAPSALPTPPPAAHPPRGSMPAARKKSPAL